ncbi:MAG: urease subunit gamma [Myxococcales bacterium]|nr:urease subunit gamma [Myxococcales bacterium]
MHLAPRDLDKLVLHQAGFLAQKRLARGLRLTYPEAVALLATQLLEWIRDGKSVAELMDLGRRVLGRAELLPGVPELAHEVQVEGTFADGTKLVTVHEPFVLDRGDLALALYGSFLPVPKPFPDATPDERLVPGGLLDETPNDVELCPARPRTTLSVTSRGDRPIQVGSHYPFDEVNPALELDRARARGMRLDVPAGTAVRFEPGETRTVTLVPYASSDVAIPERLRAERGAP